MYLKCEHPYLDFVNGSTGVMSGSSIKLCCLLMCVLGASCADFCNPLYQQIGGSLPFSGILVSAVSKVVVIKERKQECTCEDQLALNYHAVKFHLHTC